MRNFGTKSQKTWEVLEEKTVFERKPYLSVVEQKVRIGKGSVVDDFYQVRLRSFGLVVPFLESGDVLVIRQYKHGPRKVGLSFPAGFIEDNEAPDAGAVRELMEETGLKAGELVSLGQYVDNGNQRGCVGNYFLGLGCVQIKPPEPGDLEEFEYLALKPAEIDDAICAGEFPVIHHVAAWGLVNLRTR